MPGLCGGRMPGRTPGLRQPCHPTGRKFDQPIFERVIFAVLATISSVTARSASIPRSRAKLPKPVGLPHAPIERGLTFKRIYPCARDPAKRFNSVGDRRTDQGH